jgi:hypothetical protein
MLNGLTIDQMVAVNPDISLLLTSDTSHAEVARQLDVDESTVRKWRQRQLDRADAACADDSDVDDTAEDPAEHVTFSTDDRAKLHAKLDDLLTKANTDPAGVRSMRVACWDGMVKNVAGEAETVKQYGVRLESARWAPSWPVVAQSPPVQVILRGVRPAPQDRSESRWRTALILPDIQAGYFRDAAGALHPTHDLPAIDVALQIAYNLQPDEILIGGDGLDFPEVSRYRLSPAFAQTTQAAVNWAAEFVATLRGLVPAAEINWLAGNHEERLPNYLMDNARAAFGLHQAGDHDGWPVLSVPHLCRFDEQHVTYLPGYPASEYWFNDRIRAVHGDKVNSNGSTVHRYLNSERVSTISFHIHRREWGERTRQTRDGSRTIMAASPGALCRIDGAVPSTKGGTDLNGMPMKRVEDWQLGVGVLRFEPGDAPFVYEQVAIHKEDVKTWAMFEGDEIYARC